MQVLSTVNSSNLILHQIFTLYGTRIEAYKRELVWAIDKWLPVISNYTTKRLKNKAVLNFKAILYVLLCGT